jgi:hypothetical protein
VPITDAQIKFYLSGGAAQADPDLSLGGVISSVEWTGGTLHDLFNAISGDDNAASEDFYRCVYVKNTHGSLPWGPNIKAWLTLPGAGGTVVSIGADPANDGNGSTTGVAGTAANEKTPPSPAVTFVDQTVASSKATGITLGGPDNSIAAGNAHAIWIRVQAANTAAVSNDGATLNVQGDTPP